MALERVGLGGIFTFKTDSAIKSANRAGNALGKFAKQNTMMEATLGKGAVAGLKGVQGVFSAVTSGLGRVEAAVANVGQSIKSLGTKLLAVTAAVGYATYKAANFEQQMDAVGAITGATGSDMARLEKKAKQMGATTVFSATQSGQAMESLARAGANTDEIINGLSGVMNAAAADSIDLATASDIVSRVIKAMNLKFTDANRVADVLALTSARTNTDIIGLGEAFKYSASQAKVLEIPLETTAALLGAAADAGLKGSIGGTSFTNMLVKLTKPGDEAQKFFKDYNVQMTKTADGGLDIVDVLTQITKGLDQQTDVVKKAKLATEIFGIRGAKAYNAIALSIKSGKVGKLIEEVGNAQGKAEEMATRRLSNFKGQITLLKSALEGFAIETMGTFLGALSGGLSDFTKGLGSVVGALQDVKEGVKSADELNKQYGSTAVAIAMGIRDGLNLVVEGFNAIRDAISTVASYINVDQGPEMVRTISMVATTLTLVAAAAAPLLIVLGSLIVAAAGFITPLVLGGPAVMAVLAVIQTALLGVGSAFVFNKQQGEGFFGWLSRSLAEAQKKTSWLLNVGFRPWVDYWQIEMVPVFNRATQRIGEAMDIIRRRARSVFESIKTGVKLLKPVFVIVFTAIKRAGELAMEALAQGAVYASIAFKGFAGVLDSVLAAVQTIGKLMVAAVVGPLQVVAKAVVAAADAVGYTINDKLREFANNKNLFGVPGGATATRSSDTITAGATTSVFAGLGGVRGRTEGARAVQEQDSPSEALRKASAARVGAGAAANQKQPCVDVNLTDKRKVSVETKLGIDGQELARSFAKTQVELQDRRGFRATPWQRRITLEHGAMPVTRSA